MFDTFKNRLEITGTLTTVTALRISKGRSTEPIGSDLPVIKDALGRPLIPGSSFKGALRSRLESFLRGIVGSDRKLVANPAIENEWSLTANEIKSIKECDLKQLLAVYLLMEEDEFKNLAVLNIVEEVKNNRFPFIQELDLEKIVTLHSVKKNDEFRNFSLRDLVQVVTNQTLLSEDQLNSLKQKYTYDFALTAVTLQQTDMVCHLFGSPWIASKFQVRDLTVQPDAWFGQYQERDGVAIDRDTETAADGKLYDYQVVPAATPFDFKAVVENAHDWELGLLMIGLHQFETEQIPLGGGRSRGLGVVKLEIDKMRWVDVEDHPEFLLEYLKKLVMGDETAYEDAADYKDEWVQKLIDRLTRKETKLSETQTQAQ